jgi:hypothetical protein
MNKKQIALFSLFSALIISGFGIVSAMASSTTTGTTSADKVSQIEKMFGITLTDEQKTQVQTKQTEMETKKAEELAKWQAMTLDTWKEQEIARINATTQDQFDQMKEKQVNRLQNDKGFEGGPHGQTMDQPAE